MKSQAQIKRSVCSRIMNPLTAQVRRLHFPSVWVAGFILLGSLCPAQAEIKTWLGLGANNNWDTGGNWSSGSLPVIGDDLVFGTTNQVTVNYRSQVTASNFNSITLTNGGFTFQIPGAGSNKVIVLPGGSGITNQAQVAALNQFNLKVFMAGPIAIINESTNATLQFQADADYLTRFSVTNQGNLLTVGGAGNITFQAFAAIHGSGGLTKIGKGIVAINSTNKYTGPTTISEGQLTVTTVHAGTGAFTVSDNAALGVTLNVPGASLNISALTLGTAGPTTNRYGLGTFGNPTAPVAYVTNLTVNGTVYISATGVGWSPSQFTLLKYGSLTGTGDASSFVLDTTNALPTGVTGYLSNNVANQSIDLVITQVPSLRWTGQTNGVAVSRWDVGGTSNWVDTVSSISSYFLNGLSVTFDDTAATNVVVLATNVAPFNLVVSNTSTYVITNTALTNFISGTTRLIKDGPGTLVMGVATSTYSGFTYIAAGLLKLAANEVIGNGSLVTNNGILDLNGFTEIVGGLSGSGLVTNSTAAPGGATNMLTLGNGGGAGDFSGAIDEGPGKLTLAKAGTGSQRLSGTTRYSGGTVFSSTGILQLGADNLLGTGPVTWTGNTTLTPDGSPRTITNSLIFNASTTFGSPGAGPLTITGPIDFGNATRDITINSEVTWLNNPSIGNGSFNAKNGPGTLRIVNGSITNGQNWLIQGGTVILDGGSFTNQAIAARVMATSAHGLSSLFLTNNALLAINTSTLQIGYTTYAPNTNLVDVRGTIIVGGVINMGRACDVAILNVGNGGVVQSENILFLQESNYTPVCTVNLDGGTLRPTTAAANFLSGCIVNLRSGGVTVDTTNLNVTASAGLLDGGGGGLTKLGTGTLTLSGINTYNGPTLINEGSLSLSSASTGGGGVTVADGTTFTVNATNGGTLNLSALTLNGTNLGSGLTIAVGTPNSANALMNVTNLTANGISNITLNVTTLIQLSAGTTYPLIAYSGSIGGSGASAFKLGSLPPGVVGSLVDTGSALVLQIIVSVNGLVWTGSTDTNWNIGLTANWTNYLGDSLVYQEYTNGFGDMVTFDDSSFITNVFLTTNVHPIMVSFTATNEANPYVLEGPGKLYDGTVPTVLNKSGQGGVVIKTTNTHSGGSTLSGGRVQVGNDQALGVGLVTLSGSILSSDGTNPRTITNRLKVTTTTSLGDVVNNGLLTFGGGIDFNGVTRIFTNYSDVIMTGYSTNGRPNKAGPGTLTLKGGGEWNGAVEVYDGTLVLDGGIYTNSATFRPQSTLSNGTARLVLTNVDIRVGGPASNLRVGYTSGSNGFNIIDMAGKFRMPEADSANANCILARNCAKGVLNLLPGGDLEVRAVTSSDATPYGDSELNFNGGILRARTNNTGFITGLTNAFVLAGGAVIDSAGFNITISQPLLDGGGSGGLVKQGAGTLLLNGSNTYTGNTVVSNGVLGGLGTIASPLLVLSEGTLAPGASIGTFTCQSNVTLGGGVVMEINRTNALQTNDLLAVAATLNYGGTLTVTNTGPALVLGDSFTLFAAGTYSGGFASFVLPALDPGLSWNTNALNLNGSLSVSGTAFQPALVSVQPASTNVALSNSVTLAAAATGTEPLFYQWYANGTILGSATNASLALTNVSCENAAAYQLIVTNLYGGDTSLVANLTVTDSNLPVFVTNLVAGTNTLNQGASASFQVAMGYNCNAPSYQWYLNQSNALAGKTQPLLTLANVGLNDIGTYSVVVTNVNGSVTSLVSLLAVQYTVTSPLLSANGTNFSLQITVEPNRSYWLEYTTNLSPPGWIIVAGVTNTNGVQVLLDAGATNPSRLYRVGSQSTP
jgi:autotransporter-associated beta strand protein